MPRSLHLPANWLRAVAAAVEAGVLSWLFAVLGALVTYVATAAAPGLGQASWSSTAALGTAWWTLAFGGHMALGEGAMDMAPLGVTALTLVLLRGAQRRLGVDTAAGLALSAVALSLTVAVLGLAAGQGSGPHVAGALVVGVLAGLWTASRVPAAWSPRVRAALVAVPPAVRAGLHAAAVAVAASLALGVALVVLAVAVGWAQVSAIHGSLHPDVASGAVLTLAQLSYLPNLAMWALGWVSGPGFAVGAGTVYSALGTTTELLPTIPVLGALPPPGTAFPWVLGAPALLGALVGVGRRESPHLAGWRGAVLAVGAFLLSSAAVLAALGTMASGSLGPGRMASVGIHGPLVAIVLAGGLAAGYGAVLLLRLPVTRDAARRLRARPSADVTMAAGAVAGTASSASTVSTAETASTASTALSGVSAATAPTALSPSEATEPVR